MAVLVETAAQVGHPRDLCQALPMPPFEMVVQG